MIIIRVLSGRINKSGKLTLGTLFKLQLARFLGSRVHDQDVQYQYVFPQGREKPDSGGQRPCDLMSQWMLKNDAHCWQAAVPSTEYDLVTRAEKMKFVQTSAKARSAQVLRFRDFFSIRKLEKDFDDLMELFPKLEMDLDQGSNVRQFPQRK